MEPNYYYLLRFSYECIFIYYVLSIWR